MNKLALQRYFTLFFILISSVGYSQIKKYSISGYIKESGTNELLPYSNVYLPQIKNGVISNDYGFYSLLLPEGKYIIEYSFIGYETLKKEIILTENIRLDAFLSSGFELKEVTLTAEKKEIDQVQMSTLKFTSKQIIELPAIGGEKDVLKAIQLMPGVQSGSEGQSGFYVRGGTNGQNLILLDEAPVYNAQHLFGFISLFNGDALKSIDLIKGGHPARYGGRLASVLDLKMKEGDMNNYKGSLSVGLISANGTMEGPIKKDKSSFIISARKTYAEPLMKLASGENLSYGFYDLTSKLNFSLGKNDKLYLGGYFGNDALKNIDNDFGTNFRFGWGNSTGTIRWNHIFGNSLFSNTSIIYSHYEMGIKSTEKFEGSDFSFDYGSSINNYTLKLDFNYYPSLNHSIKFGTIQTKHRFVPRTLITDDKINPNANKKITEKIDALEGAIYAEDEWKLNSFMKGNFGLRYSYFNVTNKFYGGLEPRGSVLLSLSNSTSLKTSYNKMYQYIHLLSGTGVGFPTDIWIPATDNIKPQESNQGAFGIVHKVKNSGFDFTLEGYYKEMYNIISFKEGASFFNLNNISGNQLTNADWKNLITNGNGNSYGMELLINYKKDSFYGWIAYTLSWVKFQFDELNFGKEFWANYDRRHDLTLVGVYKLNEKINFSANWIFKTGNAITLPLSVFDPNMHRIATQDEFIIWEGNTRSVFQHLIAPNYGEKNQFRAEAYHRLDLNVQFRKEKKLGVRTWEIGLYNTYSRANPYYYFISRKDNQIQLKRKSLFPVIPNISYKYNFN